MNRAYQTLVSGRIIYADKVYTFHFDDVEHHKMAGDRRFNYTEFWVLHMDLHRLLQKMGCVDIFISLMEHGVAIFTAWMPDEDYTIEGAL